MKVIKNIVWASVLIFFLGYLASTATAGRDESKGIFQRAQQPQTPVDDEDTDTLVAEWQTVEVENIMPESFENTQANVVTRAEALKPVFDTLCHSGRALRVLQLGDSHTAGKHFPKSVRQRLCNALGDVANDSVDRGVVYKYFAKNGATTNYFATDAWMERVAENNPDLIILSFGTNECHGMGYLEDRHEADLQKLYDMLTQTCPNAVIMLTTPPGDYLNGRPNPMNSRCVAELEKFGAEHNMPVWNLYTIFGGESALANWRSANMLRPDRIHYQPEGYVLHGNMLGDAILTAYNNYIGNK